MTIDSYLTIENTAEGIYKEKGSKFIAYAFSVTTPEDFKNKLESIKKEHYSASHHCYAYRIGFEGEETRANDDGEPSHTAGDPILNQLKSANLTNVALVVVRYFGGAKLGKKGLINAYKSATLDALSNARIERKTLQERIEINFTYEVLSEVLNAINKFEIKMLEQDYGDSCRLLIEAGRRDVAGLKKVLEGNPYAEKIRILPG